MLFSVTHLIAIHWLSLAAKSGINCSTSNIVNSEHKQFVASKKKNEHKTINKANKTDEFHDHKQ